MRTRLASFILLTLVSGWTPAAWLWWHGTDLGWEQDGNTILLLTLMGLGPGLVAALLYSIHPSPLRLQRPTFGRHELLAWILFPCLGLAAAGISVALGQAEWDWAMYHAQRALAQRGFTPWNPWPFHLHAGIGITAISVLASPVIWFIPAYIEEFAWRGWLYAALEKRGIWQAGLWTGGLWWLWKAPIFALGYQYPGHPYLGLLVGLGFGLATSLVLTWLRASSGGLVAPAIARATLASSAMMPLALTDLYDPLVAHLSGASGLAVLGLALLLAGWTGLFGHKNHG